MRRPAREAAALDLFDRRAERGTWAFTRLSKFGSGPTERMITARNAEPQTPSSMPRGSPPTGPAENSMGLAPAAVAGGAPDAARATPVAAGAGLDAAGTAPVAPIAPGPPAAADGWPKRHASTRGPSAGPTSKGVMSHQRQPILAEGAATFFATQAPHRRSKGPLGLVQNDTATSRSAVWSR